MRRRIEYGGCIEVTGAIFSQALYLWNVVVGYADPAHLALLLQVGHGLPGFFERRAVVFGRPVNLVEIDDVDLQTPQAVFALLADGIGLVDFRDAAFRVPAHGALGEHVGPRALPFFQCPGDDFFRVADAVDGGGVDPVDAEFERAVNGGDGVGVVLGAPAKVVAGAADGPGAEAHRRDVHVRISQLARLHHSSSTMTFETVGAGLPGPAVVCWLKLSARHPVAALSERAGFRRNSSKTIF